MPEIGVSATSSKPSELPTRLRYETSVQQRIRSSTQCFELTLVEFAPLVFEQVEHELAQCAAERRAQLPRRVPIRSLLPARKCEAKQSYKETYIDCFDVLRQQRRLRSLVVAQLVQ